MANEIEIVSLNTRGLREQEKRQKLFYWLTYQHVPDIIMLQETHSCEDDEIIWKEEWGGDIVFSHGVTNSRGVCILFRKNLLEAEIHSKITDKEGRYIILDITLGEKRYTLTDLYGPNKDDENFFLEVIENIESSSNDHRIAGGDFNCILNKHLDKKGGMQDHANVKARKVLLEYMDNTSMVDIWRMHHDNDKHFTYYSLSPEKIFTRLDFFLISLGLTTNVTKSSIYPKFLSDHCAVSIKILISNNTRGKGYWKLNCSLLNDPDYVKIVKVCIKESLDREKEANPAILWETVKLIIRGETIKYASRKKQSKKNQLTSLQKELEHLEKQFQSEQLDDVLHDIKTIKQNIEKIVGDNMKGIILQSKNRLV